MRMAGRIGIGLIILAAVSWSGWTLWSSTRKWCPASVEMSLTKGSVTQTGEFQLNVTGPYEIAIEADRNKGIAFNTLTCSLGIGPIWPEKICSTPSILKLSWVLASGEVVIAHGSSDETEGGDTTSDSVVRQIGYFRGQKGQRYKLAVATISEANTLAVANPRLKVNVGGSLYEFNAVMNGFLKWGASGLAAIGFVLLLSAVTKDRV